MRGNPLNRSLRIKVTLGVVLPLLIILGAFTVIEWRRHRAVALENLSLLAAYSGQVITSNLRRSMLASNFTEVQDTLDAVVQNEDFRVVYLLDPTGQVIFAPNGVNVGTQLSNQQPECRLCHRLPVDRRPASVVVTLPDGTRVFRSMQPIHNSPECSRCHDPAQPLLGLLLTDISVAPFNSSLKADLWENLRWWVGTIVVTIVVVNLILSRFVLGRLEGLSSAMSRLGEGEPPRPLAEQSPDEIGRLAGAFNTMAQQIKARESDNRLLSERLRMQNAQRGELLKRLITAQESERKRIARELHDDLGQALGGLALQAEALDRQLVSAGAERLREQLGQMRALAGQATRRMYDLILDLRPSALDDLGLVAALRACAERLLDGTGVAYELDALKLDRRLSPALEVTLYRIFQEALSNVVRHAGAQHVRMTLCSNGSGFTGEIVDDGLGFEVESISTDGRSPRGLGVLGMQERAAQCGGQVNILSEPGKGTRIVVTLPLSEECDE